VRASRDRICAVDDDWIVEEVTDVIIKLRNVRTSHAPTLALDSVRSYFADPGRDRGNQKYGILSLHVQLTITANEVRISLLERPH
jgi:hypothetical protein